MRSITAITLVLAIVVCSAIASPMGASMTLSKSSSRSQVSRAIAMEAKQLLVNERIVSLSDETFANFVTDQERFSVVFFHASWSGRSNRFASDFAAVVEQYADRTDVQFAVLDVNEFEKSARSWAVVTFPTVKMITRGVKETANTFHDYSEGKDALVKFIDRVLLHEKFKYLKRADEQKVIANTLVHPSQGQVVELNSVTFENFTKSTYFFTFVLFYAPWCGACKEMMPEMEAVARYFKLDKKVIIGRINADDNPKLIERYGITALPTMYMFPKARLAKRGLRYGAARERHDMQAVIDTQNRMADSEDQPYIDENTDMETLMAEMKQQGKDPESLMRRFAAKSGQEYKSPDKKVGDH